MPRIADHDILPLILHRQSRVAMNGEALEDAQLLQLFEAARWAPSASNTQPWRFLYAKTQTPDFPRFFDLLLDFNQAWCHKASALIAVCSQRVNAKGHPMAFHAFDTGAAWMALALQASSMGLVAHAMGGFDGDRARVALGLPEEFALNCMVAVGHPGSGEGLSEKLRSRDLPNTRDPIRTRIHAGSFPDAWRNPVLAEDKIV